MIKSFLLFSFTLISLVTFSQGDNLRLHFQEKHPDYDGFYDVWGWDDTINEKQYAIIGAYDGFLIYDITDLGNVNLVINQNDKRLNLDIKTYQNYLFTSDGLVYNISNLPNSVNYEYEWGYPSHNIWVNNHFLFDDKYKKYDLTNPLSPIVDELASGQSCHDGYVHDSLLFTFRESYLNFSIHNLNDSINPHIIDFPSDSNIIKYSHSGIIYEKEKFLYISDERSTKIAIYDISNPSNPQFLNHFEYDGCSTPHNFWIKGDTMYMSHYSAGVIAFDLANTPLEPETIGFFDTYYGCETGIVGALGIYVFENHNKILVSDRQNGLFVFSFDEEASYSEPFLEIKENHHDKLEINPNPFTNNITIRHTNSFFVIPEFTITDVLGKEMEISSTTILNNEINLDVSNLRSGVYILNIDGEKKKIIKQ